MQLHHISLADTHSFSPFFLDYLSQKESLQAFYHRFPQLENFGPQLKEKETAFPAHHRAVLVDALSHQYAGYPVSESVAANLTSLASPRTFTVTTGHQLNLFTGPLYFIYKIVTVINTCRRLKEAFPEYNFVPVYWMASEDHDYDEIKSFRLYNKKYTWETKQTGAVGRFDPQSITEILSTLPGDVSMFKTAYLTHKTLAGAVRSYVNALFANEGLVVLDGDYPSLKTLFKTVMHDDLFLHSAKEKVEEANRQLESLGYHPQVFAREINFFYLDQNLRHRLTETAGQFSVVDTAIKFSAAEIEQLIRDAPEKFSPNVILRPLYQEVILPNLAYVGGPAEIVYWLQLKGVFEHFKTPFPILMPRNFAAVMDEPTHKKFLKTGVELKDLFEEKNYLFNHWIARNSSAHLSLGKEIAEADALFKQVKSHAAAIDTTLAKHVEAKALLAIQSLGAIERKMMRAEKRKHEDKLRQLEAIKDMLFPNGSPQERTDNFLNFYQQDRQFIQHLIHHFDPFDFRFNVLVP